MHGQYAACLEEMSQVCIGGGNAKATLSDLVTIAIPYGNNGDQGLQLQEAHALQTELTGLWYSTYKLHKWNQIYFKSLFLFCISFCTDF